ncbi:MAG TPA: TerB family tellurite resistance protein [Alphaproteobacteria bacterium]|nr:TerB family tellurite resistance protein [Alphaproteobacteria bacterium]
MIARVLEFLSGKAAPAAASSDDLEIAVAALLIEAARMDEGFDATERAAIERLLAEKFGHAPERVAQLIAEAEAAVARSTQMFPFTREICARLDYAARVRIVEMLWQVAYADGRLDPQEDMLLRRIAGLIHVEDRDRALARQRAVKT